MKIYITGIAGFLGSHLAKNLINVGHEVSGNDNMVLGDEENLPKSIKFHKTDCNDYDERDSLLHIVPNKQMTLCLFHFQFNSILV